MIDRFLHALVALLLRVPRHRGVTYFGYPPHLFASSGQLFRGRESLGPSYPQLRPKLRTAGIHYRRNRNRTGRSRGSRSPP